MRSLNSTAGILLTATLLSFASVPPVCGDDLTDSLRAASRGGEYRQPDGEELIRAEALFTRVFTGEPVARLRADWSKLAFDLREYTHEGSAFIVLVERADAKNGRGFYLFRREHAVPLALQMPHSFKDEDTRRIGLHLALSGRCAAAAWNTVPRSYLKDGATVSADLAHLPESYFAAFTRAFLRAMPRGRIVQLHGFDRDKRHSVKAATAEMIVSSGMKSATPAVEKAAACLGRVTKLPVRLYPTEVLELGGTTNAIGRLMANKGSRGFIHIEMSREFRSSLAANAALGSVFIRCMEEAGE